jgi:hypothetical protein
MQLIWVKEWKIRVKGGAEFWGSKRERKNRRIQKEKTRHSEEMGTTMKTSV